MWSETLSCPDGTIASYPMCNIGKLFRQRSVAPRHAVAHEAEKRRWLRMEFATFRAAVLQKPCQIVRGGKRLLYRLLSWTPWQGMFLRLVERLQGCWLC